MAVTLNPEMLAFRRLTVAEIPLLHRWISADPLLTQIWWNGQPQSLGSLAAKYTPRILGEEPTAPYLILYGDTPIGYIQTYLWRDYPDYTQHLDFDLSHAASLDLFIGEAAYRNRGLGQGLLVRFLREFVFADPAIKSCVITPEVSNRSAIRAYEKAGFQHLKTVEGIPDEPGPVYFMTIERSQFMNA